MPKKNLTCQIKYWRLQIKGKILDDFDLLIGSTAIFHNLILVTKNVSDFDRLMEISLEDWTTE